MKICASQMRPVAGDITANMGKHFSLIEMASGLGADLIMFPELSLSGYEPRLARSLAMDANDPCLDRFQQASSAHNLFIAIGIPLKLGSAVQIGMVWFAPGAPRLVYAKQQLHPDEQSYFVPGEQPLVMEVADRKLAPAICYESLQSNHALTASQMGADVYLASVAKSAESLAKASIQYPTIARRHGMYIVMANCVGLSDGFVCVGQSAAWGARGEVLAQMNTDEEGVIVLDTDLGTASVHTLK